MSYKIKYKVEFGNFTKEELEQSDCGGCESLVLVSIIGEPLNDDAMSVMSLGMTSNSGQLTSDQMFEALSVAIQGLDKNELSKWRADLKDLMLAEIRKAKGIIL